MNEKLFEVVFLDGARKFLEDLDKKAAAKVISTINRAQRNIDSVLFKKLSADIWEFRSQYQGLCYQLLAFWDKTDKEVTVVVATHGFIKKQNKVSKTELLRASNIRATYYLSKLHHS